MNKNTKNNFEHLSRVVGKFIDGDLKGKECVLKVPLQVIEFKSEIGTHKYYCVGHTEDLSTLFYSVKELGPRNSPFVVK